MIRHMVAIDNKRGYAKDGIIPWKLPTDENFFTTETKKYGGVVLMGRKTMDFIRVPLRDRQNFVLTRNLDYHVEGATIVHDLSAFLKEYPDVWVIGGADLFKLTIEVADELYITEIDADFDCDAFYPEYQTDFKLKWRSQDVMENGVRYHFNICTPRRT